MIRGSRDRSQAKVQSAARPVGVDGSGSPSKIDVSAWVDTRGQARFMFENELSLMPRSNLLAEGEYGGEQSCEGGRRGMVQGRPVRLPHVFNIGLTKHI